MASSDYKNSIVDAIKNSSLLKGKVGAGVDLCYYADKEDAESIIIPSGYHELDYQLLKETGGIPMGRIIEFFGPEAGGKSSVGLRILAEAQKMGLPVLLCDVERCYGDRPGRVWLQKQGLNLGAAPDGLLYTGEVIAENIFNLVHAALTEGGVRVVMIDSIASMVPRDESIQEMLESSQASKRRKAGYDQRNYASLSRIVTKGLGQLVGILADTNSMLICINQVRDYIGYNPSGLPLLVRPGGHAFKHYSSLSLKFQRAASIKEGQEVVGNLAKIKVEKCKIGPGYGRETGKDTPNHIAIYYDGRRVTQFESLLPSAVDAGVVLKPSPRRYSYSNITSSSREEFIKLIEDAGLVEEIVEKMRNSTNPSAAVSDIEEVEIVDDGDFFAEEE